MNQYFSPKTILINSHPESIHLFTQFYLPNNLNRRLEIQKCLRLLEVNKQIDTIYLLNERIYTEKELGIMSKKIKQIIIKRRLLYSDCFNYIEQLSINGYIIISNMDIFFDSHLINIKRSNLHKEKKVFCQLRYEYNETIPLSECKLFKYNNIDEERPDSQDTWIFHSRYNIIKSHRKLFQFHMGKPGCDNKLVYLWNILGYQCHNEPDLIKCYHYHTSNVRSYSMKDILPSPYMNIFPRICKSEIPNWSHSFHFKTENDALKQYLIKKIDAKQHFIIPRLAGIENNIAHEGVLLVKKELSNPQILLSKRATMKRNAGIHLSNVSSIINYSQLYLNAFEKCETYFDWAPLSNVYKNSKLSFPFMFSNFKKPRIDSDTLSIFNHIYLEPWTQVLRGQRILIISAFIESIQDKINNREKIYGIDLFPECTFVYLKPPQTNGTNPSRDFQIELNEFCEKIKAIKDDFDIALCSCGGYGNLVCSYIYDLEKSAIYVGGVLQMYFGIYGQRWISETPDIMKLYMNKHWTRPKENEKPNDYKKIENACYW